VKTAYGVVWREQDAEQAGRLEVGPLTLRLTALDDEHAVVRELAFDAVTAVELRPPGGGTLHTTVVLTSRDGRTVEIESAVERWILGELVESVFVHNLRGGRGGQRILVALELKPGCRDAAQQLLRAGPPFDPSGTALRLHDVFLLEDEALFLFDTDDRDDLERLAEPRFWQAAAAWAELMAGRVRLADHAYSWTRDDTSPKEESHPGLGF